MTAALLILATGVLWNSAIIAHLAAQLRATRRRTAATLANLEAVLQASRPTGEKRPA
jgi:hypothetical protein